MVLQSIALFTVETESFTGRLADARLFNDYFGHPLELADEGRYAGAQVDQQVVVLACTVSGQAQCHTGIGMNFREVVGHEGLALEAPQALVQLAALLGVLAMQVDPVAKAPGLSHSLQAKSSRADSESVGRM